MTLEVSNIPNLKAKFASKHTHIETCFFDARDPEIFSAFNVGLSSIDTLRATRKTS